MTLKSCFSACSSSFADYTNVDFRKELNTQLDLCLCALCNDIFRFPVMIKTCQHNSCYACLISRKLRGRQERRLESMICRSYDVKWTTRYRNVVTFSISKSNLIKISTFKWSLLFFEILIYTEKTMERTCHQRQSSNSLRLPVPLTKNARSIQPRSQGLFWHTASKRPWDRGCTQENAALLSPVPIQDAALSVYVLQTKTKQSDSTLII